MAIIIGRDAQTRQLSVIKDGSTKSFGNVGSVPMDVSRQHISLTPVGTNKWQIKNLICLWRAACGAFEAEGAGRDGCEG